MNNQNHSSGRSTADFRLKILQHIFARPFLAAIIVGSLIHFGKWLNLYIHNKDYNTNLTQLLENGTAFAMADILMPFFIPFIVISISRKLAKIKECEFLNNFPDANPDLVVKCNAKGEPIFINNTVKALLFELNILAREMNRLVPDQLHQINIDTLALPTQITHTIQHITIEYLVNKSNNNGFFLSGRKKIEK